MFASLCHAYKVKAQKGEGKLVEGPKVGSSGRRARLPKYSIPVQPQVAKVAAKIPTLVQPQVVVESLKTMSHEGEPIMTKDEKTFRNDFFDMREMVKVLYEERNNRLQGEISKLPNGEGSSGGGNGK